MDPIKKRKLDENGAVLSSDGVASLTDDDARKILEPFTPEQLRDVVQSALTRHVDVLEAVRSIADRDTTQRKLFVRGLGWDTNTDKLRSLFSAYGDLEEAAVINDKATGKSKGFGFVTFKHVDGALFALREPSKKIDGRMTVAQLAATGSQGGPTVNPQQAADLSMRKIYVGNVPYEMPAERLLAHFLSYGEVEEGPLGYDKTTGKSKGYALFVYKTAEAARAALVDPIKTLDGTQLSCKLANDGKKGKPNPIGPGGMGVQGPTGEAPPSMPGPLPGQYGPPGGSYGGFTGGLHGPPMGHNPMNSSVGGGPGLQSVGGGPMMSGVGNQPPSSLSGSGGGFGSGMGGPYGGGSHYGGPGSTGYGGLGPGGVGGGGVGRGSSLYGLPPSSGGYNDSAHYSLSSSGYGSQHHQPTGASPAPRVPHGGMFHAGPPYY